MLCTQPCPLKYPRPPSSRRRPEEAIRAYFSSGGTTLPKAEDTKPMVPRLPPADAETFKTWFPGLAFSRTACAAPRLRVLCFPNAGNAEDMYTSEGTGVRRAPSPLLVSQCPPGAPLHLPAPCLHLTSQSSPLCRSGAGRTRQSAWPPSTPAAARGCTSAG